MNPFRSFPYRINIFGKIVLMVMLLLVPVLILYSFSNRITNQVVHEQLQSSNLNQLSVFMHQVDSAIDNLSMFPVILGQDPHIRDYLDRSHSELTDLLKEQGRITEKLGLQSVSSGWSNDMTIVIPGERKVLSSNIYLNGGTDWPWDERIRSGWTYGKDRSRGYPTDAFIREVAEPAGARTVREAAALYQISVPVQNLKELLDVFKKDKESDPFLFHPDQVPIKSSTASEEMVEEIVRKLGGQTLKEEGQERFATQGQEYLVSYVRSKHLGWYLTDYAPVEQVLLPITKTSNLFYGSVGLLLLMGLLASFLLYRNVQIPIINLVRSMQRLKRGDLSARIDYRSKNEFDYLILRYNEMAEQIQVLVEDVYAEKLRAREATLKQLQSQIHPHFLYNSLFFIINSAMIDDRDSVVAMAQNLAEFYRYTTRVDHETVTLRDELDFIGHYLEIQNLRMHRLEYEISVPLSMMDEIVPRLIIQPLVENAIIHGIERKLGEGRIVIQGEQDEEFNRIFVQDNGAGATEEELQSLRRELGQPMAEDIGCGTWNVHRRLFYQFGEGSGLTFNRVQEGGLKAVLTWRRKANRPGSDSGGRGA